MTSWQIMLAIFIAVVVIAGGGVIIGLVTGGFWKDHGWLKTGGGKDYFWRDASTRRLRMFIETDVPAHVVSCILGWANYIENYYAGREIFTIHRMKRDEIALDVDILIVVDDDEENPYTLHQVNQQTGEVLTTLVGFPSDIPKDQLLYIVQHEGGHILCLGHDESTSSAMHPLAKRRKVYYTGRDSKLLTETYGGKG